VAFLLLASNGNDVGGFALFKVYADFVQIMVVVMGLARMADIRLDVTALDLSNVFGDEAFPCMLPLSPFSSAFFSIGWAGVLALILGLVLLAEGITRKAWLVADAMGGIMPCLLPCTADDGMRETSGALGGSDHNASTASIAVISEMTDAVLMSPGLDPKSKSRNAKRHSAAHVRAAYAEHQVRGCQFFCFACCGDGWLPDYIEVEGGVAATARAAAGGADPTLDPEMGASASKTRSYQPGHGGILGPTREHNDAMVADIIVASNPKGISS